MRATGHVTWNQFIVLTPFPSHFDNIHEPINNKTRKVVWKAKIMFHSGSFGCQTPATMH